MKIRQFARLALVLGGMALTGPGAFAQEAAAKRISRCRRPSVS